MNTWNAAKPPILKPPTRMGKFVGIVRVAGLITITLISVILFLLGRGLRAMLGRWVTFHFGVARFWSHFCLRLTGIRLVVEGTPIQSGSLVANHSSWIDILSLRANRLIYFVSKSEVAKWPGIGFITRITGTVFIERRRSEAKRQEQLLRDRIAHDQLLCFFPEGTSTDGLRVLPFKSSLFSAFFQDGAGADIKIQPVSVSYHPPAGADLPPNFYSWWGDMGFESHIWDVVTRSFGGTARVTFHAPVNARDFEDRKALSDFCQRQVARGVAASHPDHILLPAPDAETA